MNTRRPDNLIQFGFILLGAGLGLWWGLTFDWSGRLWLVGDVLARFGWAIGLIAGMVAGLVAGSVAAWLARKNRGKAPGTERWRIGQESVHSGHDDDS